MSDITIPPETEEKVAEAICDAEFWPGMWATLDKGSDEVATYRKAARAACIAMLKAWPGMAYRYRMSVSLEPQEIILPLPQEPTND